MNTMYIRCKNKFPMRLLSSFCFISLAFELVAPCIFTSSLNNAKAAEYLYERSETHEVTRSRGSSFGFSVGKSWGNYDPFFDDPFYYRHRFPRYGYGWSYDPFYDHRTTVRRYKPKSKSTEPPKPAYIPRGYIDPFIEKEGNKQNYPKKQIEETPAWENIPSDGVIDPFK